MHTCTVIQGKRSGLDMQMPTGLAVRQKLALNEKVWRQKGLYACTVGKEYKIYIHMHSEAIGEA